MNSQHSRMSSAPGLTPLLNLSQLTAASTEGQDGQVLPPQQQQQQYVGEDSQARQSTGGMYQSVDGGGEVAQQVGGSGRTMRDQQHEGAAQQRQEQQQQVTFASLAREHDLTPRRLPSEVPSQPAAAASALCIDAGAQSDTWLTRAYTMWHALRGVHVL